MQLRRSGRLILGTATLISVLAGCGGSSPVGTGTNPSVLSTISATTVLPTITTTPDIARVLAAPIATPTVCHNSNGESSGLSSPWVNTVDLSVFMKTGAPASDIAAVGRSLRHRPAVARVYFESSHEAYAEFQRLYTCSSEVSPAKLPSSWRVVLTAGTTVGARNMLVAKTQVLPGVEVVACDPNIPCVATVRRVDPSIYKKSAHRK